MLSEKQFESRLQRALERVWANKTDVNVRTFKECMMLTDNRGLVIRLGEQEFQITIVESTR